MSIKFVSVKCPECGAGLDVEDNRKYIFCSYCGTKIMLVNDNEYTYRRIDEAKIKQIELEQLIKLKELELEEKKRESDKRTLKLKIIISLFLLVIGIVMMIIGNILGSESGNSDSPFYMMAFLGFFPIMGAGYIWLFTIKEK